MSDYNQDILGNDDLSDGSGKQLPTLLNVLTILTIIGSIWGVISAFLLPMGCKVLEMEEVMDKMQEDQVQNLELLCNNLPAMITITVAGAVLSLIAALMMRKRKHSGFILYIAAQILPLVAGFIIVGSANLSDWKSYIGIVLSLVFIALYATQRKHLTA